VQRCGSIGLLKLHVGAALHEAAHFRVIAPHRGIRDCRRDLGLGARQACGSKEQRERDCTDQA
jgi:hypothetical protein